MGAHFRIAKKGHLPEDASYDGAAKTGKVYVGYREAPAEQADH
jgi:hypothetical protein